MATVAVRVSSIVIQIISDDLFNSVFVVSSAVLAVSGKTIWITLLFQVGCIAVNGGIIKYIFLGANREWYLNYSVVHYSVHVQFDIISTKYL